MASSSSDDDDLLFVQGTGGRAGVLRHKPPKPPRGGLQRVPTESEDEAAWRDDDDDVDDDTLRAVASRACKKIDIGTAVLPQPLFTPDVEDSDFLVENGGGAGDAANNTSMTPSSPGEGGGASTHSIGTNTTTRYARLIQQEFNSVVIEHHLKWAPLCVSEPGPLPDAAPSERFGRYDFHHADAIVDWCERHNISKIKGHVLVWHVTSPKFLEDLEPHQVREQLRRHIFTVMGHFRGRITTWDVCNECLAPDGSLAENVFYRKLGPGYIEDCFRWAHEADPDAVLLYNDNKVEGIGTPKSDGLYNLLADLKAKNVPVHGCGLQAHLNAGGTGVNRPPTPRQVKQQIRRLGQLGLTVNISELDVRVSKLGTDDPALRQTAQRQIYHDILAAALSEPAFDGIWLWGFTDRHTWVHSFYYDDEPCILDEAYRRKPAYYGVRDALATLTPGGCVGGGAGVLLDADLDDDGRPWGHEWVLTEEEDGEIENDILAGDARPDWETAADPGGVERVDILDSGDEADVEIASDDNDEILSTDNDAAGEDVDEGALPPLS